MFFCRQNSTFKICLNAVFFSDFPISKTIKNFSAGVPLKYYHGANGSLSKQKLRDEFLSIPFSSTKENTYEKNGFTPYNSLTEIFENAYTQISGDKLQVRSMNEDDIYGVTGLKMVYGDMGILNIKYCKLLDIGVEYWIPSTANNDIWLIRPNWNTPWPFCAGQNVKSGIRPVVLLKPDVKTSGFDLDAIWNIQL